GGSSQGSQMLGQVRSIYIDNLLSPVPIYVQFDDTGFTVTAQPYSNGWYPVFTNSFSFHIVGLGFTNANAQNLQFLVYLSNAKVAPYTDISLQAVLNQALSSPVLGGGSGIASVVPFMSGS